VAVAFPISSSNAPHLIRVNSLSFTPHGAAAPPPNSPIRILKREEAGDTLLVDKDTHESLQYLEGEMGKNLKTMQGHKENIVQNRQRIKNLKENGGDNKDEINKLREQNRNE